MAEAGSSRKRSFDVAFKLKVIEYSSKTSNREAGRKFGVDEKRVREWKLPKGEENRLTATANMSSTFPLSCSHCKKTPIEGIHVALYTWYPLMTQSIVYLYTPTVRHLYYPSELNG